MTPYLFIRETTEECQKDSNKNSQYCTTGEKTSTVVICLAVILPVVFIAIVIGFFVYKAYKRNKKESLDDDDPDFNGDNMILPDIPQTGTVNDQGRYRFADSNVNISPMGNVQIPTPAAHRDYPYMQQMSQTRKDPYMNGYNPFEQPRSYASDYNSKDSGSKNGSRNDVKYDTKESGYSVSDEKLSN